MTDGPFKNLRLSRRWKRFAEAVQNDAVGMPERLALASHALLQDILSNDNKALLSGLKGYVERGQLDLDPVSSIEHIFNNYYKTPFADTCQKELIYRLSEPNPPASALRAAIKATIVIQILRVSDRIKDECILARESGEMRDDQFRKTVAQATAAFDSLSADEICLAIYTGDKNAFKEAAAKKSGIDDGPPL